VKIKTPTPITRQITIIAIHKNRINLPKAFISLGRSFSALEIISTLKTTATVAARINIRATIKFSSPYLTLL
jgi:hypothetical protein